MHPENIPKITKLSLAPDNVKKQLASSKNTQSQGKLKGMRRNGSEQAIVDACWSEATVGKKLKTKLMERMQQVNKVKQYRPPSISSRTKTSNQFNSARKKQNTSNIILMVQEPGHPKLSVSKAPPNKDKDFNQTFSGQFVLSPRINKAEEESKGECGSSNPSVRNSLNFSSRTQTGLKRDNSAYFTLRDQLSKLTMEIHGDCSIDNQDESLSSRKQRRTREERKKNGLYRDASMVLEKPSNLSLKKNMSNLNLAQEFHSGIKNTFNRIHKEVAGIKQRAKSGVKNKMMRNNIKKPLVTVIQAAKENTKPNLKSTARVTNNKTADPKRYLARKYLSELYAKVTFKVKSIEREKKTSTQKKTSLNFNLNKENQNKKFCGKKNIKTGK